MPAPLWLVSRHRSSVCLRWPSKRIAALHRLPIHSVLAARCALRCAPMAARSLRHLIGDATLVGWSMDQVAGLSTADLNVPDHPGINLCNDIAAALAEAVARA
ncbi:hypothetical protein [Verminephrobacter eiseniae]|uniref:hypothetical protein n=1 Tax=Verminephrobacter eiseniae TaxID=364317 RepID=UPI0022380AEF|nr:hypothetical protein [Verminephrobacter eiseniae]